MVTKIINPRAAAEEMKRNGIDPGTVLADSITADGYDIMLPKSGTFRATREHIDWPSDEIRDRVLDAYNGKPHLLRSLGIDPGGATGWSIFSYNARVPAHREDFGVIPFGLGGFIEHAPKLLERVDRVVFEQYIGTGDEEWDKTFQAIKIEGALRTMLATAPRSPVLVIQNRTHKVQVRDEILKRSGLWITGKPAGWEDGRDVNDSQIHVLADLKSTLLHRPTIEEYWPPS